MASELMCKRIRTYHNWN